METSNSDLYHKVTEWYQWDKNEKTRSEIQSLWEEKKVSELSKLLHERMEFGTAGLRARMGPGYSQMNDLTIIQTTQGFAKYMLVTTPHVKKNGVVIGYDARHNSQRFANLAATVLVNLEIPVRLFSQITPTPYVPYTVCALNVTWGIMVTASHNPKEDNGYKVYFENGAQIISPHDKEISAKILENLAPLDSSWDTSVLYNNPLVTDPFSQMHEGYMADLVKVSHSRETNNTTPLKFTYTAMHGVGYEFIVEALKRFNFPPCIPVVEQIKPDPEFPTVVFPNPEEGKSALDLSIKTADAQGSTFILANDPDADRLAVAEKQSDAHWHVFTGNELGALLGWWLLTAHKKSAPIDSDVYLLASTVSSKILGSIAKKEGCRFIETLTGFKWMGNQTHTLLQQGKKVLFAFEEAIGFMCGTTVLDKDGVSAAMVCAELATHLARQSTTMLQHLQTIYQQYGFHVSNNSYFICHDPATIKAMFERIRNYNGSGTYPETCGDYKVKHIRDLTTGFDNSQPDNKAILPVSKSSQMITFTFENGCIATIRTSGTEPKVKYYSELCSDPAKGLSREQVETELQDMVKSIVQYFYEPERNKIIARKG